MENMERQGDVAAYLRFPPLFSRRCTASAYDFDTSSSRTSDKRSMVDLFGNAQAAFKFALGRESNFSLIRGSYTFIRVIFLFPFFRQTPDAWPEYLGT